MKNSVEALAPIYLQHGREQDDPAIVRVINETPGGLPEQHGYFLVRVLWGFHKGKELLVPKDTLAAL